MRSKDQVRKNIWKAMDREGVSRFPGAEGRIPNFAGAKLAAEKLAAHRLWKRARVIKVNPDSPQTHARRSALEEGKTLIMAVPRLRDPHPFRLLDPRELSAKQLREAATIKGALRHGRVVAEEEIPEIDFVLCGSVAVNLSGGAGRQGRRLLGPRVRPPDRSRQDRQEHGRRDHRPPDPDRARAPQGHLSRPARRHDRDAASGDRGRAPVRAPAGDPLGPPAATPDPRDPDPGADGIRLMAQPSSPERAGAARTPLEELRRIAADSAYSMRLATGPGRASPPTPTDGPDPYGNPDPEWLRIDWSAHRHQIDVVGAQRQLRRDGRGSSPGLRPRPLRRLAELARADPPFRSQPPGHRRRPARLRREPDASLGDLDPGLRHLPARLLRADRGLELLAGRQLNGRLHRQRARHHRSRAGREARPGLGRRHHLGPGEEGARGGAGAGRRGGRAVRPEAADVGHQAPPAAPAHLPGHLLRPERAAARAALGERGARPARARATTTR